jgi:hypothetical protein
MIDRQEAWSDVARIDPAADRWLNFLFDLNMPIT